MERLENNMAIVSGTIVSGFKYNHEVFGEKFYTFEMAAKRTSGTLDVIPVMISDRLINVNACEKVPFNSSVLMDDRIQSSSASLSENPI